MSSVVSLSASGDDGEAYHEVALAQADADDTLGGAAGVSSLLFLKANRLPVVGGEHDIVVTVGNFDRDEFVAFDEVDGDKSRYVDVRVLAYSGALDDALPRRKHEVAVDVEVFQGDDTLHLLVFFERQDVADV